MLVPEKPAPKQDDWHHENGDTADSGCSHCAGVASHEPWCSTKNSNVRYAFQAVLDHDCLTIQDGLILHALGVTWESNNRQATGVELSTSDDAAKLCQRTIVSTEGLRETVPQEGIPMANADEPWIREWANSVAEDMMREHSYMEVNVEGIELVSVSLTQIGASCAFLFEENAQRQSEA